MWTWIRENYGWKVKKRDWLILGGCIAGLIILFALLALNFDQDDYMRRMSELQQP